MFNSKPETDRKPLITPQPQPTGQQKASRLARRTRRLGPQHRPVLLKPDRELQRHIPASRLLKSNQPLTGADIASKRPRLLTTLLQYL